MYVYVNSFTIMQNEVLKELEEVTGEKFVVTESSVERLWQDGADRDGGQWTSGSADDCGCHIWEGESCAFPFQ